METRLREWRKLRNMKIMTVANTTNASVRAAGASTKPAKLKAEPLRPWRRARFICSSVTCCAVSTRIALKCKPCLKDLRAAAEKLERSPGLDAVAMPPIQLCRAITGARRSGEFANLSSADVNGATTRADPVAAVMRSCLDVGLPLRLNGRAAIDRAAPDADPVAHPLRRRLCGADEVMDFWLVNRGLGRRGGSYDHAESNINRY